MFRFNLRDLIWLMTLAAVGLCWYKDRHRVNEKVAKLDSERASFVRDVNTITHVLARMEVDKDSMLAYFRRNWPPGREIPKGVQTLEDENRDLKVRVSELEEQIEKWKADK